MLLCSMLCFIGNIVIIISYHGRPFTMDYFFLTARLSFTFIYTCIFSSWQIDSAAAAAVTRNYCWRAREVTLSFMDTLIALTYLLTL